MRTRNLIAGVTALALALSPMLAQARVGGGGSMGSRGGRTFMAPPSTPTAPSTVMPMQRSMTPAPAPSYAPSAPAYAPRPGFGARSPFMSGLMGGFIGAGLGGLLLGHGMFGGIGGIGSFLGFLLQIFLLVMVVRLLVRWFRNRRPAYAGIGGINARTADPGAAARPMGMGGGSAGRPVQIGEPDYRAFEQLLRDIQAAWSAQDLNGMRAMATPEMLGYFAEQLADQASRGLRNRVTDVRLERGDLSEAWNESGRDYATVAMKFSMIDATYDGTGRVVDGSVAERVAATELWTFVRAPGGRWILSAIQQTR